LPFFSISNIFFSLNLYYILFFYSRQAIALNVPAVYDVFAVAIKETVGFQQPQKCGGEKPHKGRSPSRLLAAKHIQPVIRRCVAFANGTTTHTTFNLLNSNTLT
jgi:hypothetical protein